MMQLKEFRSHKCLNDLTVLRTGEKLHRIQAPWISVIHFIGYRRFKDIYLLFRKRESLFDRFIYTHDYHSFYR